MKTLAVNQNIDLYLTRSGSLAVAEGLDAVRFSCEQAVRAIRGEMLYAADQGMPVFETAFRQLQIPQFEAAARATLLAVPNVVGVDAFDVGVSGDVLRYTAAIRSTFGPFELAGANEL